MENKSLQNKEPHFMSRRNKGKQHEDIHLNKAGDLNDSDDIEEASSVEEESESDFVVDGHYNDDFQMNKPKKQVQAREKGQKDLMASFKSNTPKKSKPLIIKEEVKSDDDAELNKFMESFNLPENKKSKTKKSVVKKQISMKLKTEDLDDDYISQEREPPKSIKQTPNPIQEKEPVSLPEKPVTEKSNQKEDIIPQKQKTDEQIQNVRTNQSIQKLKEEQDSKLFEQINEIQMIEDDIDYSSEVTPSTQRVFSKPPSGSPFNAFLFSVHEEGNHLYCYCKYKNQTICVRIEQPTYSLQFLPDLGVIGDPEQEEAMMEEIQEILEKKGAEIVHSEWADRTYYFDQEGIKKKTKWLIVDIIPKDAFRFNMADLSNLNQGETFSKVFGKTSSLSELFFLKRRINGPQYVRISNWSIKESNITNNLFITVNNIEDIEGENIPQPDVPGFRIATMAFLSLYNHENKKHEIFLCVLRVYSDPQKIETFPRQAKSVKQYIFACNTAQTSITSEYSPEQLKGYQKFPKEAAMLKAIIDTIDNEDIDILSSYDLTTNDLQLLFERSRDQNVTDCWKLGRLKHNVSKMKYDITKVFAGRLPIDIRICVQEFLHAKANDFTSVVATQLKDSNDRRVPIESINFKAAMSDPKRMEALVRHQMSDARLIATLIGHMEVLPLTMQISNLSSCPWFRVLRGQATHRCESLLLKNFFARNSILPEKIFQKDNTGKREKDSKYKGGMVLSPKSGFYDDIVIVLDFNSLYPSIIRQFNICFSTVDIRQPGDPSPPPKEVGVGILPQIMEFLLGERSKVKKQLANAQKELGELEKAGKVGTHQYEQKELEKSNLNIKQLAIKVLANSIYGYLGYKGSRFPATKLAALITSLGRTILQDTVATVSSAPVIIKRNDGEGDMSFSIDAIYGDTDSVMLLTNTKDIELATVPIANDLISRINKKYDKLRLALDHTFLKMLLVSKKKYAALNYLGPNIKPQLEVKGLDMVRRDWCNLTKYLSEYIINEFMQSPQSKDEIISVILGEVERIGDMMRNNGHPSLTDDNKAHSKLQEEKKEITVQDLVIQKSITKELEEYSGKQIPMHVTLAKKLHDQGRSIPIGFTVQYLVTKGQSNEKVPKLKEEVHSFEECDVDYYMSTQILPPIWRLCQPFGGILLEQLQAAMGYEVHQNLTEDYKITEYPHTDDIKIKCPNCKSEFLISPEFKLICPHCETEMNWKYACHLTIKAIKELLEKMDNSFKCSNDMCHFISNQFPLQQLKPNHNTQSYFCEGHLIKNDKNIDVYNNMRYWRFLFEKSDKSSEGVKRYQDEMHEYMDYVIGQHGFNHIHLTEVFPDIKQKIMHSK